MSGFNSFLLGLQAGQQAKRERTAFDEAMMQQRLGAEQARRQGMMVSDAGALAADGDYVGASNLAAEAGHVDLAKHFAGMDEAGRKAAAERTADIGKTAAAILSMPPDLQVQAIRDHGQRLGFDPQEIEQAVQNPQIALTVLSARARDVEKMIGQSIPEVRTEGDQLFAIRTGPGGVADVAQIARRDPTYAEQETARSNQAVEAISRKNAETARINANKEPGIEPPKFSDITSLRKDFSAITADYRAINDNVRNIRTMAGLGNSQGDLALVVQFTKLLDPGSVAREGEVQLTQSSASMVQQAQNWINRLQKGNTVLPADVRAAFLSASEELASGYQSAFRARVQEYTDIAQRHGIDPRDVIVGYEGGQKAADDVFSDLPPGFEPVR